MPYSFDTTDRRILEVIQEEARISNTELADRVGLSPSPCWRRVRTLEATGVIERYVTLVNAKAVGLPITVFATVTLEKQVESAAGIIREGGNGATGSHGVQSYDRRVRLPA